ncbi:transcriptional regulator [Actinoplanes sp. NPDC051343]|uniref:transcriptional regulator n=1 Tax=Actinoplanes sp. NPDC051343 TaxID=3363906 RepID=UPI003798BA08
MTAELNGPLSDPTRLAIMSVLCAVDWCDFAFLRDEVSLSDSALSKQLTTLKNDGQIEQRRTYLGRVPKPGSALPMRACAASSPTPRRCSRSSRGRPPGPDRPKAHPGTTRIQRPTRQRRLSTDHLPEGFQQPHSTRRRLPVEGLARR